MKTFKAVLLLAVLAAWTPAWGQAPE